MTYFGKSFLMLTLASAVIGCAQKTAPELADRDAAAKTQAQAGAAGQTIKPGASVRFSHELRAPVDPGGAGVVALTVNEAYESGTLTLQASSKAGLRIAPNSAFVDYSMDGRSSHVWDIYFEAEDAAGVYYIDIFATTDDGAVMTRSHSIAVQVGAQTALKKSNNGLALDADESGEPVVIMEADETVDP